MTSLLLILFLDYFPFFHVKSRQWGIMNNLYMNILGLFTIDKVFNYLDTSVTSVELNNWPRKNVSKIKKKLHSIGHYRLYRAIFLFSFTHRLDTFKCHQWPSDKKKRISISAYYHPIYYRRVRGAPPVNFKMQRIKWCISRHIFTELRWRLCLVFPESWVGFQMHVCLL